MKRVKWSLGLATLALAAGPLLAAPQGSSESGSAPYTGPGGQQVRGPRPAAGRFQQPAFRRRLLARRLAFAQLMRNPLFRERAGITPEQASKFEAEHTAFSKTQIRNRADLQIKRLELAALLRDANPDRAQLDKKLREMEETRFAAQKASVDHQLALRTLFPLEQRQRMQGVARGMFNRGGGTGMNRRQPAPPRPPEPPGS